MVKAAVFDNYAPKVDCVDKSRDRATGISLGEGYGEPKTYVVKEEMQSRGAFEECINPFIRDDGLEWRDDSSRNNTHSSCAIGAGGSSEAIHPTEVEERGVETAEPIRSEDRSDEGITHVPIGELEEAEECEPCENSVEESINGGDSSECPEMGDS